MAGVVLRTALTRVEDRWWWWWWVGGGMRREVSMVSGAGMDKKRASGRHGSPGPQVIPIKDLVAGPHHPGASLPATWPWVPCPVSEQRGLALCSPAAAVGPCTENPSNPSEVSGSPSAVSGQTGRRGGKGITEMLPLDPTLCPGMLSGHMAEGQGLVSWLRSWLCPYWLCGQEQAA